VFLLGWWLLAPHYLHYTLSVAKVNTLADKILDIFRRCRKRYNVRMGTTWIKPREAAQIAGVTRGYVYQLAAAGAIRSRRSECGLVLVRAADVKRWARQPKTTGRPRVSQA